MYRKVLIRQNPHTRAEEAPRDKAWKPANGRDKAKARQRRTSTNDSEVHKLGYGNDWPGQEDSNMKKLRLSVKMCTVK